MSATIDIASLGIRVDTTDVRRAATDMDAAAVSGENLGRRAGAATNSINGFAAATGGAQANARRMANETNALGGSQQRLSSLLNESLSRLNQQQQALGTNTAAMADMMATLRGTTAEYVAAIAALRAHQEAMNSNTNASQRNGAAGLNLIDIVKRLAGAFLVLKLADYAKDAALLNARYETLGIVMNVVGSNSGYTATQMDHAADALQRTGISMIEARQQATRLVQAHIDLAKATDLARIAQNAAVIANINSSEAFASLIHGITTGQSDVLRTLGLNISIEQSYKRMADQLHINTDNLTQMQKTQAVLNAIMEAGVGIAGSYEKAMDTASKQLLSMKRYQEDLRVQWGETFNEVLTVTVMALTDHLKDSNKEVSKLAKNGELAEWGKNITHVFAGVADAIGNAITLAQKFGMLAGHLSVTSGINAKYDQQETDLNSKPWPGYEEFQKQRARINAARAAELAQEEVDNIVQQGRLAGNFDRFSNALAEREKAQTEKHKKEADARLKIDTDYAAAAQALLKKNAGLSIEKQQEAQTRLFHVTYEGDSTYKEDKPIDKPKKDGLAEARLAGFMAEANAEIEAATKRNAALDRLDDLRRQYGKLSDDDYYENKKKRAEATSLATIDSYNKQLDALEAKNNGSKEEEQRTQNAIDAMERKLDEAEQAYAEKVTQYALEDELRKGKVQSDSEDAQNKYIEGLTKQAAELKKAMHVRQMSASAIEQETVATWELAMANQAELMSEQKLNGATQEQMDDAEKVLAFLRAARDAHKEVAEAMASSEVELANEKAAKQAADAWSRTAHHIESELTDAIITGGEVGWKRLLKDMQFAFAKMVLRPILSPISGAIAGFFNPGGAQAASGYGGAGGVTGGAGSASNLIGAAQTASSMYSASLLNAGSALNYGYVSSGAAYGTGFGSQQSMMLAQQEAGMGLNASGGLAGTIASGVAGGLAAYGFGEKYGVGAGMAAGVGTVAAGGAIAGGMAGTGMAAGAGAALAAIPVWGWVAMGAMAILGGMQDGPESDTRLKFGSNNAPGNISINERGNEGKRDSYIGSSSSSPLGSFGVTSTFWMESRQPIIEDFLKTVSATDTALAQFLTATEKAAVGMYLTDKSTTIHTGPEGSNPNANGQLEDVFRQRIHNIMEGVESGLSILTDAVDGNSQVLAAEAANILKYRAAVKDAGVATFGIATSMAEIAGRRTSTESVFESIARITDEFTATNAILVTLGKTSVDAFGVVGLASLEARERLITLSGGMQALASQTSFYTQNFIGADVRLAQVTEALNKAMDALGLSSVDTITEFNEQINSLTSSGRLATEAGATLYAQLMALAPAFLQVHPAAPGEVAGAVKDVVGERARLQEELDRLTMDATALREKERATIDSSNLSLFDAVVARNLENEARAKAEQKVATATTNLNSAYAAQANTLKTLASSMTAYRTSILKFRDDLRLGSDSPLTPAQKYEEAKKQYQDTLARAEGGDSAAQGALQGAASSFLSASRAYNASSEAYLADFKVVQDGLLDMAGYAKNMATDAERQLAVLDKQVEGLVTVNASVLSVQQAIVELAAAMRAAGQGTPAASTPEALVDAAYRSGLGRAPDAEGGANAVAALKNGWSVDALRDSIANSPEAKIRQMYQALLGRVPDAEGFQFYMNAVKNGESLESVRDSIQHSPEYKSLHGSHKNGLKRVPFDGYRAELHKDERVLTAVEARTFEAKTYGAASNAGAPALVAEIRALRAEVAQLRLDARQQTGAAIAANLEANNRAAATVVTGFDKSAKSAQWVLANQVKIK